MTADKPIRICDYLLEHVHHRPTPAQMRGRGFYRDAKAQVWEKQPPHNKPTMRFVIQLTKEFLTP